MEADDQSVEENHNSYTSMRMVRERMLPMSTFARMSIGVEVGLQGSKAVNCCRVSRRPGPV